MLMSAWRTSQTQIARGLSSECAYRQGNFFCCFWKGGFTHNDERWDVNRFDSWPGITGIYRWPMIIVALSWMQVMVGKKLVLFLCSENLTECNFCVIVNRINLINSAKKKQIGQFWPFLFILLFDMAKTLWGTFLWLKKLFCVIDIIIQVSIQFLQLSIQQWYVYV